MYYDVFFILAAALVGGLIALIGFIMIIGKRISRPKEELERKIDSLKEEIKNLKDGK